ncbi:hypothetical protein [Microbulbifer yueqingensis]|uniref:hypothetical protein n=1 Tax=Microbulbifer yueqingensis TaxID=658219 RepID=UPI0011137703|nr:hypothetical protein [Microbulbifer yueqingensis]
MVEILNANNVSLSLITLLSLVVNAVTIYHWISQEKREKSQNKQAFHLLMGLAHSTNKRSSMIVRRIESLKEEGRVNDDSMIFLENMWSESRATADNLLAAAKALSSEDSESLPYDSDELMAIAANKTNQHRSDYGGLHKQTARSTTKAATN